MVVRDFYWLANAHVIAVILASCILHTASPLSAGIRPSARTAAVVPRLALDNKEFEYLEVNGYVTGHVTHPERTPPGGEHFEEDAERAIESFQQFYQLPVSGVMDPVTKETMWKPRCGFPDVAVLEKGNATGVELEGAKRRRVRRYNDGGGLYKWDKRKLTYTILNYPSRGKLKPYEVRDSIKQAFGVWADVTPLEFQELEGSREADIRVGFFRGSHSYDKDHPMFDGPDGELAHAFSPNSGWGDVDGDVHFDDAEIFGLGENENVYNFFQIAAHEIGHSLGLDHSREPMALMWPHYHYISNFRLPKDDILGIQSLYGSNPSQDQKGMQQQDVSHCVTVFDAVTSIGGVIYVFKGGRFWEIAGGKLATAKDGRMTDDYWYQIPARINAVYYRSDGRTVFFKGAKYWVYYGQYAMPGYPRPVAELGLPSGLDAALAFNSAKTYFFKKNQMWRFDENRQAVDIGYPKKFRRVFKGLPKRVLSAFRHTDGQLYFLSGKKYYRVNRRVRKVDKGYPRYFTKDFMGCNSVRR
ncbi:matrix metalloproteinase-24-like [Patiria miniata]|uniref:Peptidase metallopeptidase domain-containing protein n=1 Tax=Patiria miniata TaxID=46514 RepID=A0A914ARB4_PATMI|nr:matrix metalloproteinase-24-like [Patiria miniata]XP_038065983.1 matrix metalloproteinase-24-like [Patiria miniata]XP_038065984.1 matrix metalloproteinase-24-like [Patiria miniata]